MPLLFVCVMLVLAACASSTLTATPTVIPTDTATPAPPTATPAPTVTPAPRPVAGTLYVDAAYSQGQVSRLVYGTNHGPWAFLNPDVYPQFKESGLTLIRFPGGNWGDENDIEQWHVDQFITLCRMINAQPLISARLRGSTLEKAVALMQYARQQGYTVRYWSIGNEPSLYAPKYAEWDTAYYNVEWRKFAQAMKAVDPNIILVGPDTNQFMGDATIDPKDKAGRDWLREFLKANGDLVDVVAVHRYPFPINKGERPTRDELFADTPRWDTLVANLRQTVREETRRDLPIAIAEFNSSWSGASGGETGMDTLNNALWLGDVLGRLIRQRVDVLAQFSLQSGANVGGYGLFTRDAVRPTYYTYQMYKDFGDELVYAASDASRLSIYAARKGEALTLILVNLNDQPITRPLVLDHFAPSGPAQARLLDGAHQATRQPDVTLGNKTDYTVPPLSITLLTIPGKISQP